MFSPEPIDFGIEIGFDKDSPDPSRVFKSMSALIDSLHALDVELVKSIDVHLEPVLMLEDVEAGSLRAWLRSLVNSVDDNALKEGDWKKVVGTYLIRAKYILVRFLDGKERLESRDEVESLQRQLLTAAEETGVRKMPIYSPITTRSLLGGIQEVNSALALLATKDNAKFMSTAGDANFNRTFQFSMESLEDLLTRETISNEATLILKVKKPDYLGESRWEFHFENRTIEAKIRDMEWLGKFQSREEDVRPGDALKARVSTEIRYSYEGEVISTKYTLEHVIEVIRYTPPKQIDLT
jgi:hypothetical protein